MKLTISLNGISFKILSYSCYLHEGIAFLRRLSRSAFIMTYNKDMLSVFVKKTIELPLFSNNTLVVKASSINKGYKIVNGKYLRELNKDH